MSEDQKIRIDHKYTLEAFFRTKESFDDKRITAMFMHVIIEIASQIKMTEYYSEESLCCKSYRFLAKQARVSIATIKRELKKVYEMGIFECTGYTESGHLILEPGRWFDEQTKVIQKKKNIEKCGTIAKEEKEKNVNKDVDKMDTPVHHDLPPQITVIPPPAHSDLHITNAFTDLLTKDPLEQQPDIFLTTQEGAKEMNENDIDTKSQAEIGSLVRGLIKRPKTQYDQNHYQSAVEIMAKRLERPVNNFNNRFERK